MDSDVDNQTLLDRIARLELTVEKQKDELERRAQYNSHIKAQLELWQHSAVDISRIGNMVMERVYWMKVSDWAGEMEWRDYGNGTVEITINGGVAVEDGCLVPTLRTFTVEVPTEAVVVAKVEANSPEEAISVLEQNWCFAAGKTYDFDDDYAVKVNHVSKQWEAKPA